MGRASLLCLTLIGLFVNIPFVCLFEWVLWDIGNARGDLTMFPTTRFQVFSGYRCSSGLLVDLFKIATADPEKILL